METMILIVSAHLYILIVATVCTSFVVGASFSSITAIALDRYLALFLRLLYQELVTKKRVDIASVISWVNSAIHKLFSFEKKFDVSTTNSNVLSYDSDTSYTPEPEILLSLFAVDLVET